MTPRQETSFFCVGVYPFTHPRSISNSPKRLPIVKFIMRFIRTSIVTNQMTRSVDSNIWEYKAGAIVGRYGRDACCDLIMDGGEPGSLMSIANWLQNSRRGNRPWFPCGDEIYLFFNSSTVHTGCGAPLWPVSAEVKQSWYEIHDSLTSTNEAKNEWSSVSTSPCVILVCSYIPIVSNIE